MGRKSRMKEKEKEEWKEDEKEEEEEQDEEEEEPRLLVEGFKSATTNVTIDSCHYC